LAGGDLFGLDLLPIAFELFGHELDEAGDRALSHLRARDADHASVVGLNQDPGVDLGTFAGGLRDGAPEARRQTEPKRQPATRGSGSDDERAS